ncbi:hypothetical protein [Nocardia sp. A7]|uniref:hypothetical protein n=1 Tax=Nocardia sp. A7 TaxID=2789274 RepID=UPI00397D2BFE
MSTRSVVTTSAAALLLTGAAVAIATPAQAFPNGWWGEKTYVCSSTNHAGAPLPDLTVKAGNEVGAAFYATQQLPDAAQMQCRPL